MHVLPKLPIGIAVNFLESFQISNIFYKSYGLYNNIFVMSNINEPSTALFDFAILITTQITPTTLYNPEPFKTVGFWLSV
jgi:hypothetical protein